MTLLKPTRVISAAAPSQPQIAIAGVISASSSSIYATSAPPRCHREIRRSSNQLHTTQQIKLFDQRLLQRGAIQSYEGNVNSHTYLQLGVNLSETLVTSGGEDCYVRVWNIKDGKLIFEENVSNSVHTTICGSQSILDSYGTHNSRKENTSSCYDFSHSWGIWMGSQDGLFYMHGT